MVFTLPDTSTDFHHRISDKMTPQSSKSTTDKVGEGLSGTMDKAQR